ncbi:MAG: ribonuclease H-like YkuK family protein [Clostridia bacterium]|jgi:predicted RNase H-related nuclease YkuK (DUF458 family)|nr:ribonuclease H-like YkuK family protein [Clostridia bacterium]MDD4146446.1 ribonuclease H-like YkuK family protein [Clostridia bacterium]MDD4666246.1 ribonuclease H-like YkuK family protein [Clostridia bacterium]
MKVSPYYLAEPLFRNTKQETLTFSEMFSRILSFIKEDPKTSYRIAIGTDSMVKTSSCFITAVLVHRVGKGAIGFLKKVIIPRPIHSLREKISTEITFTQEIAYMFTPERIDRIYEAVLTDEDKANHLNLEIHLDIGAQGPTKELIKEMVNRVSGMGFDVKIKPYSTAASSLANRYTK